MDFASSEMSEGCLYLNNWSPLEEGKLKPVMFFIHAEGFRAGSASQFIYEGKALAAIGNMVVVVQNFRLGAFGFLYGGTPEMPGNVGLFDQAMALQWAQDNIRCFGGDPKRMTIFRESSDWPLFICCPRFHGICSKRQL